jgi:PAS domain S-box-containing protein
MHTRAVSSTATQGPTIEEVYDALDRVNAVVESASTGTEMWKSVLGEMLDIFACDRAWLLYPCSVEAESYRVPMIRTRREWPSAIAPDAVLPMDPLAREMFSLALASAGPFVIGSAREPLNAEHPLRALFGVQSALVTTLRPKGDQPWALGIHHCATAFDYVPFLRLFTAVGQRITDGLGRMLALENLRRSEEHFRILVEHAPEAIVLLDVESGRFVEANSQAEKLFGMPRAELLQVGPVDLSPEVQASGRATTEAAEEYMGRALQGEFPIFEWTHKNARGQLIECEVRLAELPGRRWLRGSVIDISERKSRERERRSFEERLAQSQKLEAIGQLTGGVAHDFNNLLTVIMGNLELLVGDADKPLEVVAQAKLIQEAADRARALTYRLLAFARKQPLRPTVLDAGKLVRGMDDLLRRTLGEQVDLDIVVSDGLWLCEVDATQLESSLLNLAINARDAMPTGGRLTIEASNARLDSDHAIQHEAKEGQYVLLAVSDSGIGIPPELVNEVFTPFFTTKEKGKGSGLGLSMVFGFVKQSGGHIKVYSEPGRGTTMKVFLPRSREPENRSERPGPAREQRGRGQRILLVEDDPRVREVVRRQLVDLGYDVVSAAGQDEGLAVIREDREIALLLTDVVLSKDGTGLELATRARERRPDLRVLFMSGYSEDTVIHHGRLDPDVLLLEKPFNRDALARRVREAMGETRE